MDKKIIFISHISEEKELAIKTKELIEKSFLGMIEVFVSSDENSISMGQKWLDNITDSLKNCAIEIILCSPKSVIRPWINFEAGAGWIKDIPVIPLCHSGIEPSQLPMPLNLLQAAKANEISSLKLLFPVIAQALGSKTPEIDYTNYAEEVKKFEEKYTFWDKINEHFAKIHDYHPQIIPALKDGKNITIDLTESNLNFFKELMKFLTPGKILALTTTGTFSMTPNGAFYGATIIPLEEFTTILKDDNFNF